jgi:hypothetical protein
MRQIPNQRVRSGNASDATVRQDDERRWFNSDQMQIDTMHPIFRVFQCNSATKHDAIMGLAASQSCDCLIDVIKLEFLDDRLDVVQSGQSQASWQWLKGCQPGSRTPTVGP